MPLPPLDEFLEALERRGCAPTQKANGRSWSSRCPAHEDRNPSLSVSEGRDGKVIAKCHAGCDFASIVKVLALDTRSSVPAARNGHAAPEAEYRYVDESNEHLFTVCRFANKRFAQLPANGRRGPGSMGATRLVLYRLPEVLAAIRDRRTVYVVEGEKDVHAVERAGSTATCNPGGAGKWRDAYSASLTGGRVVIVADRDQPGRDHARTIARSLRAVGVTAEIVEAAAGKDVADHLAEGLILEELVVLQDDHPQELEPGANTVATDVADVARFRLRSFAGIKRETVELLLPDEPPIPVGTLTIFAGMQGLGKSLALARLTAKVTRAGHAVILIGDEDGAASVTKPRLEAAGADLNLVYDLHCPEDPYLGVRLPRDSTELATLAAEAQARLVVIDPWTNHLDGVNPNRGEEVREALRPILAAARDLRFTLAVVAHLNKSTDSDPLQRIAHSGAISQLARAAFLMGRDPEHEGSDGPDAPPNPYRVLAHVKANLTDLARSRRYRITTVQLAGSELEPPVVTARLDEDGYADTSGEELLATGDPHEAPARRAATDLLRDLTQHGPVLVEEVKRAAKALGISDRSLQRAARRKGYRAQLSNGVGSAWVYVPPPVSPAVSPAPDTVATLATLARPAPSRPSRHVSPVSPDSPDSPPPPHTTTCVGESETETVAVNGNATGDDLWAELAEAEASAGDSSE